MNTLSDTALSVPSSNFETRKFKQLGEHTLRIQPTVGSLAFSLMFFLVGLGLIIFWMASTFSAFVGSNSVFVLLIGLLFAGLGLAFYRSSNEQLIVNRETGAAFIRSWRPSVPLDTESLFRHIKTQEINAIQLVSKVVTRTSTKKSGAGHQRGRKTSSSYTEFQVNICSNNDERFNAMVTLQLDKAEMLGTLMAKILEVQLVNQLKT